MKRLSFFAIIFWLAACIPVTGQERPLPTSLPTETATPLAEESEFVTYQDLKNKFEITYSKKIFTPDTENSNADLFVLMLDIGKLFPGKNLENFVVTVSAGQVCRYKDIYDENNLTGEETINDTTFSVYSRREAETSGNVFQTITYQTYHNDLCYEIHLNMREYSLTAFPDVPEYDPEVVIIEFKKLLGTFKFID
jgi:hypothetical protein